MDAVLSKFNLTKKHLFYGLGYLLILISIPISFSLVERSQIFKSRADEIEKPSIITDASTLELSEVPASSPLEDLKRLTETQPVSSSSGSTADLSTGYQVSFGPVLNFKVSLEGRPTTDQSAKVFVGIASASSTTRPTYILTFTVDVPTSGIFNGLSLAGLTQGTTYRVYIKGPGQIDTATSFTMFPTESNVNGGQALALTSGDLNEDNIINTVDYTLARTSYGATATSSNWNERADFNKDGIINNFDLAIINKNLNKTGNSGVWQSTPVATSSGTPQGGSERTGGYWVWMP